jgi:predicted transcriptional regulator
MRLEIIIPDSTRPELKARLTSLTQELSAHPELVEDIYLNGEVDDAHIQRMFTPERLAHIEKSDAEIDAGNFFTGEQVQAQLKQKHAEWVEQHQH